jgi:hypothetical protein
MKDNEITIEKEAYDLLLRQGQRASTLFEERTTVKRFITNEIKGLRGQLRDFNDKGVESAAHMVNGMMTAYNNVLRLMEDQPSLPSEQKPNEL